MLKLALLLANLWVIKAHKGTWCVSSWPQAWWGAVCSCLRGSALPPPASSLAQERNSTEYPVTVWCHCKERSARMSLVLQAGSHLPTAVHIEIFVHTQPLSCVLSGSRHSSFKIKPLYHVRVTPTDFTSVGNFQDPGTRWSFNLLALLVHLTTSSKQGRINEDIYACCTFTVRSSLFVCRVIKTGKLKCCSRISLIPVGGL